MQHAEVSRGRCSGPGSEATRPARGGGPRHSGPLGLPGGGDGRVRGPGGGPEGGRGLGPRGVPLRGGGAPARAVPKWVPPPLARLHHPRGPGAEGGRLHPVGRGRVAQQLHQEWQPLRDSNPATRYVSAHLTRGARVFSSWGFAHFSDHIARL